MAVLIYNLLNSKNPLLEWLALLPHNKTVSGSNPGSDLSVWSLFSLFFEDIHVELTDDPKLAVDVQ